MQIKIFLSNWILTGNSYSHLQRKERHEINSESQFKQCCQNLASICQFKQCLPVPQGSILSFHEDTNISQIKKSFIVQDLVNIMCNHEPHLICSAHGCNSCNGCNQDNNFNITTLNSIRQLQIAASIKLSSHNLPHFVHLQRLFYWELHFSLLLQK